MAASNVMHLISYSCRPCVMRALWLSKVRLCLLDDPACQRKVPPEAAFAAECRCDGAGAC